MFLLFKHLSQSLRKPDHWLYASWLDVVTKYRKTRLGLIWVWVPPALYIWGIGLFIGAISPVDSRAFVAFVGVGFLLFRLITTVVIDATSTYAGSRPYIHDGEQRLTDYLLRTVARSSYYFLLALPLLVLALLSSDRFMPSGIAMAALGLVIVYVNLMLYAMVFSLLGARFPDLSEFMGSAIMFAFLVTPVVWYPTAAPEGTVHGALMRANPLHHLLAIVREPLFGEAVEPLTWYFVGVTTIVGIVLATWAYGRYSRRVAAWL
jgi:ABC-type polysaccharide/polyol phosphate export permease